MHSVFVRDLNKEIQIGKIVCVGRNYAAHAAELGNEVPEFPLIFMKPPSAVVRSGNPIRHPDWGEELHHEVELVLLLGKDADAVAEQEAKDAILAHGVGLDMTLRDWQQKLKAKGEPWTLAKGFNDSAVVADFLSVSAAPLTYKESIQFTVNGAERQNSTLGLMLFNPYQIISYLSKKMKLEAGDLIYTGTPAGVSRVFRGDVLRGSIQGLPPLETSVV